MSTSALVASPDKSCSGTSTELFDPEIVIVLPVIERVCLSESSLDSNTPILFLADSNSSLVANDSFSDLDTYLVSAVASLINPVREGISEVLANFSSPVRIGK